VVFCKNRREDESNDVAAALIPFSFFFNPSNLLDFDYELDVRYI